MARRRGHAVISISAMLPPAARRKYLGLHGAVEDARAAGAALSDRRRRCEEAVHIATDPANGRVYAKLVKDLEGAGADLAAIEADWAGRVARLRDAESVLSPIEAWFARFNDGPQPVSEVFVDVAVDVAAAETRAGETIDQAVERVRGDLFERRAELIRLRNAPLPAAEIKRQITAEIDRMARRPAIHLDGGRVKIQWPDVSEFAPTAPNGSASGMMIWLHRDEIVERMTSAIDEAVPAGAGIPLEDRGPREAALLAEVLSIEREEEALIMLSIAAGRPIARRRDADVMAILGIAWPSAAEPAAPLEAPEAPPALAAAE
jgi:hypothetical protein